MAVSDIFGIDSIPKSDGRVDVVPQNDSRGVHITRKQRVDFFLQQLPAKFRVELQARRDRSRAFPRDGREALAVDVALDFGNLFPGDRVVPGFLAP